MSTLSERKTHCLRASFTADAAALGLHWLYDHARLAALAGDGRPLPFRGPDRAAYEGVAGYFAHENRTAGDLSHYGDGMKVLAESLAASPGKFSLSDYLTRFADAFGPAYTGYRDHATRETLANLAAGKAAPGTEDDQISATAKLPPLIAALLEHPDLAAFAEAAATATNEHPVAREAARVICAALAAALHGSPLVESLEAGLAASTSLRPALTAALNLPDFQPVAAAQQFGPACGLASTLPLSWHLLRRASSWAALMDGNLLAGGDSCGRATLLGALYGATEGLPEGWFSRLNDAAALNALIAPLSADS